MCLSLTDAVLNSLRPLAFTKVRRDSAAVSVEPDRNSEELQLQKKTNTLGLRFLPVRYAEGFFFRTLLALVSIRVFCVVQGQDCNSSDIETMRIGQEVVEFLKSPEVHKSHRHSHECYVTTPFAASFNLLALRLKDGKITKPKSTVLTATRPDYPNSSRGKHMSSRGKRNPKRRRQLFSARDHSPGPVPAKTGRRKSNLTEEERLARRRASREKWRANNENIQRLMSRKAMAKKRNGLKVAGGQDWVDYQTAAAEHSRAYRSRKEMEASASTKASASGSRKRQKKCASTDEEEDAHDEDNIESEDDSQWLFRLGPRGPPSAAPTNILSRLRPRGPPAAAPNDIAAPASPAKAVEDNKQAAKDACRDVGDVEPHVDVHDFNEPASLLDIHHAQSDDEEDMAHPPGRRELLFLPGTSDEDELGDASEEEPGDEEEPPARVPFRLNCMVASRRGPFSRGSSLARSTPPGELTPLPEVPLPVVVLRDDNPPVPPPAHYFRPRRALKPFATRPFSLRRASHCYITNLDDGALKLDAQPYDLELFLGLEDAVLLDLCDKEWLDDNDNDNDNEQEEEEDTEEDDERDERTAHELLDTEEEEEEEDAVARQERHVVEWIHRVSAGWDSSSDTDTDDSANDRADWDEKATDYIGRLHYRFSHTLHNHDNRRQPSSP
ncbi:hypothetical protein GGX14DRAFT_402553 [Mycena pura]|uniref:Uncharacterized protein n=1 Tax=Mycena pura TaxID=153505 RepID=A0AAD6UYN8_9AGAR|nr:hypothetical protein GGX14DRAFT_402553 [Mycena pura]